MRIPKNVALVVSSARRSKRFFHFFSSILPPPPPPLSNFFPDDKSTTPMNPRSEFISSNNDPKKKKKIVFSASYLLLSLLHPKRGNQWCSTGLATGHVQACVSYATYNSLALNSWDSGASYDDLLGIGYERWSNDGMPGMISCKGVLCLRESGERHSR